MMVKAAFRGNKIHDGQSRRRAQRYRLLIRYRQESTASQWYMGQDYIYTPRCRTGMRYFVKDVMKSLIVLYLVLTELWRIVFVVVTMSDYVCHPLSVTKYYYSRPCFNERWLIPTSSRWAIFSTITICSCIGTKKLIVSRQPIFINLNNLIPWKTLCKVINYSLNFQINNVIILCLYLIININYIIRLPFVFVINKYLTLQTVWPLNI